MASSPLSSSSNAYPNITRLIFATFALILLSACSTVAYKPRSAASSANVSDHKSIVIFFDGTRNNEVTDTNVKKLHSLVDLQSRSSIATLYVEGVGNGEDLVGAVTGSGIKTRVEIAYEFLLQNYEDGDRIYLFGFSRGAYSAQMLNSLLYHAGIVKTDALSSRKVAERVFAAVKEDPSEGPENDRIVRVRQKLTAVFPGIVSKSINVEILGLWDTVGALGVRDRAANALRRISTPYELNVDVQNARHGVKLCNVKRVFHALSIDDNRELQFTPLLLSRTYAFDACVPDMQKSSFVNPLLKAGKIHPNRLQEVWFAGAHADVGGGYPDSLSSGVSLNWMIGAVNSAFEEDRASGDLARNVESFLPPGAKVSEDIFGTHHNPRRGLWSLAYTNQNRNIAGYVSDLKQRSEAQGICVHDSVLKRRLAVGRNSYENDMVDFREEGSYCFIKRTDSVTRPAQLISIGKSQAQCDRVVKVEVYPNCGAKNAN